MSADQTVDFVVMFLTIGLVVLGLLSVLVGRVVAWWDRIHGVNHSQVVMSPPEEADRRTERTDGADGADGPGVSAVNMWSEQLEVDRTKTAVIEVLVYSGWTTAEIRSVVKGENATIGAEVDAARKRLGIDPPERTLRVRDAAGERVIPY